MPINRRDGKADRRYPIDRDALHEWLWEKSDSAGRVPWKQKELAEMFGVTIYTMSSLFNEMRVAGRLKKVRATFYVQDPEVWRWRNPAARLR